MKVYVCNPGDEAIANACICVEEDGLPYTSDRELAERFIYSRASIGDDFYRLEVYHMPKGEYEVYKTEHRAMEIVLYQLMTDIGNPRFNKFPIGEFAMVPILNYEKDFIDDGIYASFDEWSNDLDTVDTTKFKKKLRRALHKLGILQIQYSSVNPSEFDKFGKFAMFDFDIRKIFDDGYGKLFTVAPF